MRRGRGNRKATVKDHQAEAAWQKRRDGIWRLRCSEGLTQTQIAERLGISQSQVSTELKRACEERKPADADELRAVASSRLDTILAALAPGIASGDPQSCNAATKAISEYSKLHGLYAPEKRELSGPNGGPIDIKAAQDDLLGRIARLAEPGDKKPGDPEPEPV